MGVVLVIVTYSVIFLLSMYEHNNYSLFYNEKNFEPLCISPQAARRLATGWTARVRSRVSEYWRFFNSSMFRLVLGTSQPPVK